MITQTLWLRKQMGYKVSNSNIHMLIWTLIIIFISINIVNIYYNYNDYEFSKKNILNNI
jgi:hypothetical protein